MRRVRGKLSKKEQKEMKKKHKDIGWLLASPPPQETVIHEREQWQEKQKRWKRWMRKERNAWK